MSDANRSYIAGRAQALMNQRLRARLVLRDGTEITGRVTCMSLNGAPDPADKFDAVTVTIDESPIALGRIADITSAPDA